MRTGAGCILTPAPYGGRRHSKLVLGLALVMGVRVGLKAALAALFGEAPFADGVRYLCIALAGGVLWPMTFGFWSRLGRKRASQPHE